jgi:CHAT domain-containing protein/tetratricopeptide (TPR) repeat protein
LSGRNPRRSRRQVSSHEPDRDRGKRRKQEDENLLAQLDLDPDLIVINEHGKQLYLEGRLNEALTITERFVRLTKAKYGAKSFNHAIALLNLGVVYKDANESIKRLMERGQYGKAIDLAAQLVASTREHFGAKASRHKVARANLKVVEKAHEQEFSRLYQEIVAHSRAQRYDEALPLAERIVELGEAFERSAPDRYADALTLLAQVYVDQMKYLEAEPLFKRAVNILEQTFGSTNWMIANRRERLGEIYRSLEYYSEAEEQYKRALMIRENVPGMDDEELGRALNALGLLYLGQARLAEAEALLNRALALAETGQGAYSLERKADALNNLGLVCTAALRFEEAEQRYLNALDVDEGVYGSSHPEVATIVTNLGLCYLQQSRYKEAREQFERSLMIIKRVFGAEHPSVTFVLHNLAMLSQAQGELGEAERLLRRSLKIREQSFGADDSNVALSSLGWVLLEKKNWTDAYELFARSTKISAQRSSREGRSPQNRADIAAHVDLRRANAAFLGQISAGYELARHTPSLTLKLQAECFRAAQWGAISDTGSAIARMAARYGATDANLTPLVRERQDLIVAWQEFDRRLTVLRCLPQGEPDPRLEATVRSRIQEIDKRIKLLDQRLNEEFPGYVLLTNPEPLSIPAVQQLLTSNEALLKFLDVPAIASMPERTFVWVITKSGPVRWYSLPLGSNAVAAKVHALRCGLDPEGWEGFERRGRCETLLGTGGEDDPLPFDLEIAHGLYEGLFSEFEDFVKDKHLLIVSSGPLTSLPFSALVTERPRTALPKTFADYKGTAWLCRRQPISVLPSVTSLVALRRFARKSAARKAYIGYGDPVLDGNSDCPRRSGSAAGMAGRGSPAKYRAVRNGSHTRSAGVDQVFRRGVGQEAVLAAVRALCPLPDSADEINGVARSFGGPGIDVQIRLAQDATEADIKGLNAAGELESYRVVHFATHGVLAGDPLVMAQRQGEPALVMTPPQTPRNSDDDGLLMASEVAELKLDADWVILSACNTASGETLGAEAFSGLARAFFYAGARTLLVSQWPVYSDAAVQLIIELFATIHRDSTVGRAEALRRSMVALMDDESQVDNSHPSVWAPFVVVGEGAQ